MHLLAHEIYNALPGIDVATNVVRRERDFDQVMRTLGSVVLKHDLEKVIGIRLLHRHNDLRPNDLMVETIEEVEPNVRALVTSRQHESEVPYEFMPSMWACRGPDDVQQLEYTKESLLPVDRHVLRDMKPFFRDFAHATKRIKVEDYLGVCVLERNDFPVDKDTEHEVESTDIVRPANIIRVRSKEYIRSEFFYETTWQVHRGAGTSCPTTCCSSCTPRIPGHELSHHTVHPTPD